MNFSIIITTFSKRYHFLEKLISQIRTYSNCDIIVMINGNYNEEFDEEYRKMVLNLCWRNEKTYPIFFPEQRGLAKLWNTGIIHSKTDWNLILNEDVEIIQSDIFSILPILTQIDLYTINSSYSHFYIHKKILDDIGYFDERLLGFGTEDSDFTWRYIKKYNRNFGNVYVNGIINIISTIIDNNIKTYGKYSSFNAEFCFGQKNPKYIEDKNGLCGSFSFPVKENLPNETQYPYEKFFWENKHRL